MHRLYLLPYLLAGIVLIIFALLSWRQRRSPGAWAYSLMLLFLAAWTFPKAFQLDSPNLHTQVLAEKISSSGAALVPTLWFVFALWFTGQVAGRSKARMVWLSLEPALVVFSILAYPTLRVYWNNLGLVSLDALFVVSPWAGPVYWLHVIYSFLVVLAGCLLLTDYLPRRYVFSRRRLAVLAISVLIPCLSSLLFQARLTPFYPLDYTPVLITLVLPVLTWGFFFLRPEELLPTAFRSVFDNAPYAILAFDGKDRLIKANPAAQRMFSKCMELIPGASAQKLFAVRPMLLAWYEDPQRAPTEMAWGDGEDKRCFALQTYFYEGVPGRSPGCLIFVRETTREKSLEAAAKDADTRYRILAENTQTWEFWIGPEGGYLFISSACEAITGYSAAEFMREPDLLTRLVHPDDLLAYQAHHHQKPAPGEAPLEIRLQHRSGSLRWIAHACHPVFDPAGQYLGMRGSNRDITDIRHSKQALQRRVEEMGALHASLVDITASQDFSTLLDRIVRQAARMLDAYGGSLFLCDQARRKVSCVVSYQGAIDLTGQVLDYGQGSAGSVAESGAPLIINDYRRWENRVRYYGKEPLITALISVPLVWQGQVTGVLNIHHLAEGRSFSQTDQEMLMLFGNLAAIAVENSRLLQAERKQRQQAETLREVARVFNATLDRHQVLHLILEQLERVVEYDSASVMLVNGSNLSIVANRKFHTDSQLFTPFNIRALPHIEEVINQRRPVVIADTSADERWLPLEQSSYIRCWLGAPLIVQDRVIGLLNLDKEQPGFYGEEDAHLAMAFANQAAIAIENARLFESAERRAEEAETLRQATSAVVSTLNLDEALERILVQLERVVPFDSAWVQLLRNGCLEIVGGRGGQDPASLYGNQIMVPGDNPNTFVVEKRQPYLLGDAPSAYPAFFIGEYAHIHSWLGAPLVVHDRVIGMLALDSVRSNHYNAQQARLVSAFADQVAIAIENARLYKEERDRVDELNALRATVADILAELELNKLLAAILERAVAMMGASGGDIGLFEPSRNDLEIVTSFNLGKDFSGTRMKLGEGAMGVAAETCQPVIVDDYQTWTDRSPQYASGPWHAVLAAPLMIGGRLLGAIGVVQQEPGIQFTQAHQRMLNLFAQQAAIAVENARLYQSAKEAAEHSAVLHQVSQEIVAVGADPEGLYAAIHRAASRLMPTEAFAISLLNETEQIIDAPYLVDDDGRIPPQKIPLHRGLSGHVIDTGQAIYIEDILAQMDSVDSIHFGDPDEARSILAVPMRLGGKVIGMLSAQSYSPSAYTPEDEHLLEMLASYAAIALDNGRLFGEVQQLAITDPLTGLYNRRHLYELGQREFSRAKRFSRPLCAVLMDIDHFKQVNDTYGHAAGDRTLQELARRFQDGIREVDVLGRYGGEEFVIFLSESDLPTALSVAERLRQAVADEPIHTERGSICVTMSVGVTSMTSETPDLEALVANADIAMYKAKRTGRNRVASI